MILKKILLAAAHPTTYAHTLVKSDQGKLLRYDEVMDVLS